MTTQIRDPIQRSINSETSLSKQMGEVAIYAPRGKIWEAITRRHVFTLHT